MNRFDRNIIVVLTVLLFSGGCASYPKPPMELVQLAGKEVALKQTCFLEEYALNNQNLAMNTLWENGKPTQLIMDDRLFGKPVKNRSYTVGNMPGFSVSFYPVADYHGRSYQLITQRYKIASPGGPDWELGPNRVFELPVGTKVLITKIFTRSDIENGPRFIAAGQIHLAETGEDFTFECYIGSPGEPNELPLE